MLWRDKVQDLLDLRLGSDSEESKRFRGEFSFFQPSDPFERQRLYLSDIEAYATSLASIIQRLEMKMEAAQPSASTSAAATEPSMASELRIFIAHDGRTNARLKLEEFIRALGAEPWLRRTKQTWAKASAKRSMR